MSLTRKISGLPLTRLWGQKSGSGVSLNLRLLLFRTALLWGGLGIFHEIHDIANLPEAVPDASSHCRTHPQLRVHPHQVIIHPALLARSEDHTSELQSLMRI